MSAADDAALRAQVDKLYPPGCLDERLNDGTQLPESSQAARSFTYGEITSPLQLLEHLGLKATDVFYDLGSGRGQLVLAAAMERKCGAVGVELLEPRHAAALAAQRNSPPWVRDLVEFRLEDALLTPIADATHVFLCNTCFPWELNAAATKALSLARAPRLARVATTVQLPEECCAVDSVQLRLTKVTSIEGAWSSGGCALYLYERCLGTPSEPVIIDSAAEQMSQRRASYARQLVDRPADFGETAASAERVLLRSSMFAASLAFITSANSNVG